MPDDILDAAKSDAQKAIDDAAKSTGVPPASPPPPSIPEPIPVPPAPPAPITPTVDKPIAPNSSVTDEIAAKEKVVDEILQTEVVAPIASPPQPPETSLKKSGAGKKGTIIAILLLLLILPVAVYFISLQNEQLAEIRSRATEDTYPDPCHEACAPGPGTGPGSAACNACRGANPAINCGGVQCNSNDCHCQGGDACTSLRCEPDIHTSCINQGRAWCDNFQSGAGKTCCVPGYVCGTGSNGGCVPGGENGGGDNPTPTPTPGNAPQCNLVKVYKGGVVVSDLSSLSVGDDIVIAVAGNNASKGRIRLNGGAFTEVPTPTNGEYQLSHTILAAEIVNNKITIEAEIFGTDGNWH